MGDIRASVDIGSNSLLLLIAEIDDEGRALHEISSVSAITSLGKKLDQTKKFSQESMDTTLKALEKFSHEIKKYSLKNEDVLVTATEASRVAENSEDFFNICKERFHFSTKIINSMGEAYYTSLGVSLSPKYQNEDHLVIMDIGGASTEIIKVQMDPFKVEDFVSLSVGSVRATDWIDENCFMEKMEQELKKIDVEKLKTSKLVCVAGTMVLLGCIMNGLTTFDQQGIENTEISFSFFSKFLNTLKDMGPEKLLMEYPILGKRSQTILGGARVAKAIAQKLEVQSFCLSSFGLRHGTLFKGNIEERYLLQKF